LFDPFWLAKPFLHALDPEDAHEITLCALESGLVPGQPAGDDPDRARGGLRQERARARPDGGARLRLRRDRRRDAAATAG
jgi:hypothetical protein